MKKAGKLYFIIDDDPDDQELFIEALQGLDEDCRCETAFNGQEAMQKLVSGAIPLPDFIFLDLNMPLMNGRQFLTEIKNNSDNRHIPVIIYSTSTETKDVQDTMQLGAVFFLQKPNRFDDLKQALAGIINRSW